MSLLRALKGSIQWPVKPSLPVHVLPVLPFDQHMDVTMDIVRHLLVLGSVKASKSHNLHHFNLVLSFTFEIFLCEYRSSRWRGCSVPLAAASSPVSGSVTGPVPLPSPVPGVLSVSPPPIVPLSDPLPRPRSRSAS